MADEPAPKRQVWCVSCQGMRDTVSFPPQCGSCRSSRIHPLPTTESGRQMRIRTLNRLIDDCTAEIKALSS